MNPYHIIEKYYDKQSQLYHILITHSECVLGKALAIARNNPHLNFDIEFIKQATLLHDIGIFLTNAPNIECHGQLPYIAHGYLGRELIEKEGYPHHAKVCERHTGCGLSVQSIIEHKLPIPKREMVPVTLEEQLICFADKFYSKSGNLTAEKTVYQIRNSMQKHGKKQIQQFDNWCHFFNISQNE